MRCALPARTASLVDGGLEFQGSDENADGVNVSCDGGLGLEGDTGGLGGLGAEVESTVASVDDSLDEDSLAHTFVSRKLRR
jgi:hypothetical protein